MRSEEESLDESYSENDGLSMIEKELGHDHEISQFFTLNNNNIEYF